jgi:hypothetical protein
MKRLLAALRHEVTFPLWQLLAIAVFADIVSVLLRNPPWWALLIWAAAIVIILAIPSVMTWWIRRHP